LTPYFRVNALPAFAYGPNAWLGRNICRKFRKIIIKKINTKIKYKKKKLTREKTQTITQKQQKVS